MGGLEQQMLPEGVALQLAVCSAILAAVAYLRFGNPDLRSQTTALRYHTTAIAYCFMALFLYYLIALSPRLAVEISGIFFGVRVSEAIAGMLEKLPPAVFALLFVLALPQFPKVATLDQRVRAYFRRIANIPLQAQWLSARLVEAEFQPGSDVEPLLRKRLEERGFTADAITGDSDIARKWRRVGALCLSLDRMKARGEYQTFAGLCAKSIDAVVARWRAEMNPARAAFRRCREVESLRSDLKEKVDDAKFRDRVRNEIDEILTDYEAAFSGRLDALHKQACDLVSRAILMSFRTHKSRAAATTALGFDMKRPVGISGDQIIFTSLILLVSICLAVAGRQHFFPTDQDFEILVLGMLVTTTHVVAVGIALLSQRTETIRDDAALHARPYGHYLRIGFIAAALAIPVPMTAILIVKASGVALPVQALLGFLPICLLAGGSAAMTAFNIDNGVRQRPPWAGRFPVERLAESAGQGLAMAVWTFLILKLVLFPLMATVDLTIEQILGEFTQGAPPELAGVPVPPLLVQFVAGSIIGFYVPHMYRAAYADIGREIAKQEVEQSSQATPVPLT